MFNFYEQGENMNVKNTSFSKETQETVDEAANQYIDKLVSGNIRQVDIAKALAYLVGSFIIACSQEDKAAVVEVMAADIESIVAFNEDL
jgi:hypothetical protein